MKFMIHGNFIQGGAPPGYKWIIIHLTIDMSPINHSCWTYVHQLSQRTGAPPCGLEILRAAGKRGRLYWWNITYIPSASRTQKCVSLFPKTRSFSSFLKKNTFVLETYFFFTRGKQLLFLTLGVVTSHDPFPQTMQTPFLILVLDLSPSVPLMLTILPPRWLWLALLTRKDPMLLEHVGHHRL